jgi:hypothetical protein
MGGELALEPSTAMNTAVINQKVVHGLLDGLHGRSGGSIVQVGITTTLAVIQWDQGIETDE